jgi:hypothetical protein
MERSSSLKAYLIHSRLFPDRLAPAFGALIECGLRVEVVRAWDAGKLNYSFLAESNLDQWAERLPTIIPTLAANVWAIRDNSASYTDLLTSSSLYFETSDDIPVWMKPRKLKNGEKSVLLKHFYALGSIANGNNLHGIIAEDDIMSTSESKELLDRALIVTRECGYDYVDLAGGAGMHPEPSPGSGLMENIALITPARTRTNACYLVSRKYAEVVVNNFFPLVFPIDWHLQYIFKIFPPKKCGWTRMPPFIHGSESGIYKSWQS